MNWLAACCIENGGDWTVGAHALMLTQRSCTLCTGVLVQVHLAIALEDFCVGARHRGH